MGDTPDDFESHVDVSGLQESEAELTVIDEWRRDAIVFPTVTDALLAKFALSMSMQPSQVDQLFQLLQHPGFNFAERTLTNLEDIHSYAHVFRKNKALELESTRGDLRMPTLVWEGILSIIGSGWVQFVMTLFDNVAQRCHHEDVFSLRHIETQDVRDLRSVSLVHPGLTRLAQRQLGRVLLLHNPSKKTIKSAIRSPLYGSWTQILAIRGFRSDGMPISLLLENLVRRLPRLTHAFLRTTQVHYPQTFLEAFSTAHALETICVIMENKGNSRELLQISDKLISLLPNWRGLRNLLLVGFIWRPDLVEILDNITTMHDLSLPNVYISAFSSCMDPYRFLKRIGLGQNSKKRYFARMIHIQKFPEGEDEPEDVATLLHDSIKSLLPKVHELRLDFMTNFDRDQVLNLSKAVQCLTWFIDDFCDYAAEVPDILFPTSLRKIKLIMRAMGGFNWHAQDRRLKSLIERNKHSNLKELVFSFGLRTCERHSFPEIKDERFPHLYFPRTSHLCEALDIPITSLQDWHEGSLQ